MEIMIPTIFTLIIAIYITVPVLGHVDIPEACVVHPFSKKSMDECDVAGEFWSLMVYNSREVFICCKNERDASIVAAPSERSRGLYYGDAYKLCETIYVDQETCRSRESRDCNYHTATYKNQYIGCFFCRARCENDYQCGDLGRVCSICRPEQPATACTEPVFADHEPLKLYHGQPTQSGYIDNNLKELDDQLINSENKSQKASDNNNSNRNGTASG
ncbi:uncharacterized protein LOC107363554 [Tetranychus urticae]|uniref:TNFR-Cys domain-containing protein n=1 Tax=Tetranychus urticae TaxID=32264 RepID=T1KFC8_TETUR|nr:uncharacterized protein LOC107363554 [Tetranychus urticae]